MSKTIIEVPFQSDRLQAVRDGEAVWVVVRRVCEALGIDPEAQRQRLTDPEMSPWATTCLRQAVAADGKSREIFAVDLDSLPMWLATISPKRVRPEARNKLIAYQRECARVLRDHFFGQRGYSPFDVHEFARAFTREFTAQVVPSLMNTLYQHVEQRLSHHSAGIAGPWEVVRIRNRVKACVGLAVSSRAYASRKAAYSGLWMRVKTACGWTGKLKHFPAWAIPEAMRELDAIEREFERAGNVRQLPLGGVR